MQDTAPGRFAEAIRANRQSALGLAFEYIAHEAGNGLAALHMRIELLLAAKSKTRDPWDQLHPMMEKVEALIELVGLWRRWEEEVPPLIKDSVDLSHGLEQFAAPFVRSYNRHNTALICECDPVNWPAEQYVALERELAPVLVTLMGFYPPEAYRFALSGPHEGVLHAKLSPSEPGQAHRSQVPILAAQAQALRELSQAPAFRLSDNGSELLIEVAPTHA